MSFHGVRAAARRSERAAALRQAGFGAVGPLIAAMVLPSPASQLLLLSSPHADATVGALAVLLATGVVWSLLAWGIIVVAVATASRLPGACGAAARSLLGTITPALVRRVVLTAVGASVVAGLTACGDPHLLAPTPAAVVSSAAVHSGTSPVQVATAAKARSRSLPQADFEIDLDWPISHSTPSASADRSSPRSQASAAAHTPTPAAATPAAAETDRAPVNPRPARQRPVDAAEIVVLRGDTLWSIAASRLPAGASAALIDASWRAWYAANTDTIGADPNLIKPGQVLRAPRQAGPPPTPTAKDIP